MFKLFLTCYENERYTKHNNTRVIELLKRQIKRNRLFLEV